MPDYWFRSLATGEKVIRSTVQEISRAAQREANRFGQAVQIHTGMEARKSHRKESMARNPVMQGHDFSEEKWKVTGKNPRTGGFIHAYADNGVEAKAEARVLRGAGYTGVMVAKVGAKALPKSKAVAMGAFKRNPAEVHHSYRFLTKAAAARAAKQKREDTGRKISVRKEPGTEDRYGLFYT